MSSDGPSLSHLLRERIARHARAGRIALLGRFGPVSYAGLRERIERIANALPDLPRGENRRPARVALARYRGRVPRHHAGRRLPLFPRASSARRDGARPPRRRPRALRLPGRRARVARAGPRPRRPAPPPALPPRRRSHPRAATAGARPRPTDEPTESAGTRSRRASSASLREPLTTADPAMVQLTSGSTGEAKGVVLTHGNLLCNARGIIGQHRTHPGRPAPAPDAAPPHERGEQPVDRAVSRRRHRRARGPLPGRGGRGPDRGVPRDLPDRGADHVLADAAASAGPRADAGRCDSCAAARRRSPPLSTSASKPRSGCRWWSPTACPRPPARRP